MALASSPSNGIPRESMARSATLDYARFLAAVGIIVFHVGAAGANIGYAALPFFLMLLVVLAFPGQNGLISGLIPEVGQFAYCSLGLCGA